MKRRKRRARSVLHLKSRPRKPPKVIKGRYGVNVSYEFVQGNNGSLIRHAVDQLLHDEIAKVSPTVKRHKHRPDSGCLLPLKRAHQKPLVRDLQYDDISYKGGFTKAEANRIAKTARKLGAKVEIKPARAW